MAASCVDLLPELFLEESGPERPEQKHLPADFVGLAEVLGTISRNQSTEDAVRCVVNQTKERYGYGEVARLFERFAQASKSQ
ncbi:MAG: hypothetical protein K2X27_03450 [Candidatus Obscuribacterales bacterium]|nr:hypothetical protein [Candidatus Obscuribacterales bacterium]